MNLEGELNMKNLLHIAMIILVGAGLGACDLIKPKPPKEEKPEVRKSEDITSEAKVLASSSLPDDKNHGWTYGPASAVDGDKETCWSEGDDGDGVGEWIKLSFPEKVVVTRIGVIPGYDRIFRDDVGDRFYKNNRVRELRVEFSDGTTQSLRFKDSREMQFFVVPEKETRYLRFTVAGVYTDGAKWADCCISEITVEGYPVD